MSLKGQKGMPVKRDVRIAVYQRSDGYCWYCGCELQAGAFDVDHFVARSMGGDDISNLVPACRPCNRGKRDRSLEEFRAIRKRQRDGIPLFTIEQHAWLSSQGFQFPSTEPFQFWFEEHR